MSAPLIVIVHKPIVTSKIFNSLLGGEKNKKIIIDLALPADVHNEVIEGSDIQYIGLNELKKEAEQNLREREAEVKEAARIIQEGIEEFHGQFRTRKVELKMREVPEKIREIKTKAMTDIFAAEINSLDDRSKEVLQNVMDYMEKKCISVPMIMAKEIILSTQAR